MLCLRRVMGVSYILYILSDRLKYIFKLRKYFTYLQFYSKWSALCMPFCLHMCKYNKWKTTEIKHNCSITPEFSNNVCFFLSSPSRLFYPFISFIVFQIFLFYFRMLEYFAFVYVFDKFPFFLLKLCFFFLWMAGQEIFLF